MATDMISEGSIDPKKGIWPWIDYGLAGASMVLALASVCYI